MRKKLIAVMTAGAMMAMAGAPVQAAEGEKDVVIAQADGNVSQDSVDRANELLNAMPERLLEGFVDRGWRFYVTDKNIAYDILGGEFNSVKGVLISITTKFSSSSVKQQ